MVALPQGLSRRLSRAGSGGIAAQMPPVEPLGRYLMTYTAYGPLGRASPWASPADLVHWEDGRVDVYYGMADSQIGVARLDLPAQPVAR
jgi:predicted GH43/DUF377 family glycosyl hydrolase